MNTDSPFEQWRTTYLKGIAFSPEILELVAAAFEAGQLSERNKPVDVNELQQRMLKSAYVNGIKHGREDEREACALECITIANKPSNVVLGVALECADAIRARGRQ